MNGTICLWHLLCYNEKNSEIKIPGKKQGRCSCADEKGEKRMNGLPASIGQFETSGMAAALILILSAAICCFFSKKNKSRLVRTGNRGLWLVFAAALLLTFVPSAQMTAVAVTCDVSEDGTSVICSEQGALRDNAFINNVNITNVILEKGVTSIGSHAFDGCSSLVSITIPDSVTTIGYCAFRGCSSLESVIIPDSVTSISSWAFYGCSSLESVTIPDGMTIINDHLFTNCRSLSSITIPGSVTVIDDWAFANCSSLESVTIPEGVTTIDGNAFWACPKLSSVTIPNSMTTIGNKVFLASSPIDFYYNGTAGEWDQISRGEKWATDPIVHTLHTLTINYVYAGNTEAAPSYSASVIGGTDYSVDSPVIDGFTPDQSKAADTMPDGDLSVTVTYTERQEADEESTFDILVDFVFLRNDGTRGVPFDIKEGTVNPVLTIKRGDAAVSKSNAMKVKITAGAKDDSQTASFSKEVTDLAPGKYTVSVSGLPKEIAGLGDGAKYRLTPKAEVNKKNGATLITVYLIFSPPEAPAPAVYSLPEDEVGAYTLLPDGTKEYLLFHTYDICMAWLGKAELCEGPERCFHKDGK